MYIQTENLGKRYQRYWVFRNRSLRFLPGSSSALLGHNGSGKSTLLRILAGMQSASEGSISWTNAQGNKLQPERLYEQISFCAPGMELPEELSMTELLNFHFRFKKPLPGLDIPSIIALTGLESAARKPLVDFSSGMKQRVKLAQALFSNTPLLLLDEPCSNLDDAGVQQYQGWMDAYSKGRTVIVASNDEREYRFCSQQVWMKPEV
ncbi:MAG: ABC transporter ATP-binding protein [Bacteroidetes bacterium]|nr:ABC transporter ATP-binding protein [Bacteroidota bacterium]MBS1628834.1 ABC transporter ATP-binding protein [Bacteroidota bacterium]